MLVYACLLLSLIYGNSLVQGQSCDYSNVDKQCTEDIDISFCGEISGLNTYDAQPCLNQFMIALQEDRIGQEGCFFHACGATLIAPNLVITAAHCIYPKLAQPGALTGETLTSNLYAAHVPRCRHYQGYGRYQVVKYWINDQYDDSTLANDIAILQLNTSVQYATIAKYDSSLIQEELLTADLNIVGWGATNVSEQINVNYNVTPLRGALQMNIIPREQCVQKLRNVGEFSILYPGMICAENFAADACSGDSGGPLIYKRSDLSIYLVGVVSWGARDSQCFTSDNVTLPGVYSNVTYYKDWINNIVELVNPATNALEPEDEPADFDDTYNPQELDIDGDDDFANVLAFKGEGLIGFDPMSSNLTIQQDAPLPQPSPSLTAPPHEQQQQTDCSVSLNGCNCLDECFDYLDGNGYVCSVDLEECVPQNYYYEESVIIFTIEVEYGYVDQCKPDCVPNLLIDTKTIDDVYGTIRGCGCMSICDNPSNNPNGNWCLVNPNRCPESTYDVFGEYFYDFCTQEYRGNSSRVGNCNGGCLCKPQYNQMGELLDDFCESPSWLGNLFGYKPYCEVINPWECNQSYNEDCKNQC